VALACLINALLFVRVAVLYAPGQLLGPSGADRVFYYAYARSLVVDRDLDFRDEIAMRPPTSGLRVVDGRLQNKYPIGSPLLSLPWYAVCHGVLEAAARLGPGWPAPDGYSRPYVLAYALGQLAAATAGFWLLYLATREYFDPVTAALAAVAAILGTGLLRYTAMDLMMSHAASFFSLSWCLYESVRLPARADRRGPWLRLGASSALIVMTRLQNAVFWLIPLAAALRACAAARRDGEGVGRSLRGPILSTSAFAVAFAPQLIVWRLTSGSWVINSYSAEAVFHWRDPRILGVLGLLAKWTVIGACGVIGSAILAYRRRDPVVGASVVGTLLSLYVIASWWAWDIAGRVAFDQLGTIAMGLGVVFEGSRRISPWAPWLGSAALALWNIPLAAADTPGGLSEWLGEWVRGVQVLL
jgi:hypothetical protein